MRHLFLFLVLSFYAISINAQKIKINFIDSKNNPVQDVDLYINDIIAYSSEGKTYINTNKNDYTKPFLVSKFGYKEEVIQVKSDTTIILKLNQLEKLDLIELIDLTPHQYLDSIYKKRSNTSLYHYSKNMKLKKVLFNNTDTLFYLKEKYKFQNGKAFINPQNKIFNNLQYVELSNPNNTKTIRRYFVVVNEMKTHIPFYLLNFNKPTSFPYNNYFKSLVVNKNDFDFELSGSDEKIRIDFNSKKKRKNSFKGYIVFNKYDYGIYEFFISQIPHKKNKFDGRDLKSNKNNITAIVKNHTYFVSYYREETEYLIMSCQEEINFETVDDNQNVLNWINYRAYERSSPFTLDDSFILDEIDFKIIPN